MNPASIATCVPATAQAWAAEGMTLNGLDEPVPLRLPVIVWAVRRDDKIEPMVWNSELGLLVGAWTEFINGEYTLVPAECEVAQ